MLTHYSSRDYYVNWDGIYFASSDRGALAFEDISTHLVIVKVVLHCMAGIEASRERHKPRGKG